MADSFVLYTADGATDTFSIPFGYLESTHVTVKVDGSSEAFTFPTSSQAQITSGNPTNGAIVEVRRTTPRDVRQVVWQNAANLTEDDLNTADLQLLYIIQEAFDSALNSIQLNSSGVWDAESVRITNAAVPTEDTDVCTKFYLDNLSSSTLTETVQAKNDAEAARDAAIAAVGGVKISTDDTTPAPLEDKVTVGTGLAVATSSPGGDESFDITLSSNLQEFHGLNLGLSNKIILANGGSLSFLNFQDDDSFATAASTALASSESIKALVDVGNNRVISTHSGAKSATTILPYDSTIPQNTEGTEVTELATAITPKLSSSKIKVTVTIPVIDVGTNIVWVGALFKDSDASAINVTPFTSTNTNYPCFYTLVYYEDASSTSERTYKFRYGPGTAGTTYIGRSAAGVTFGDALQYSMVVEEIPQ